MPPYRIVARHPDPGHHDHAWAHVGGVYDALEDAVEDLAAAAEHPPPPAPASLAPEDRVRVRLGGLIAEMRALGYEEKVQELEATEWGADDAGNEIATAHEWRDVQEG